MRTGLQRVSLRSVVVVPLLVALVVAAGLLAPARGEEPATGSADVAVATPRGVSLQASLHRPAKPNGTGIVIAPGQGYHRGRPLIVKSAEGLVAAGFTVLTFDWGYFTAKGEPSESLDVETEDLEAALAHLRKVEGVTKVLLAGKSLGSLVALRRAVARADDLAGVALLTLPLHDPGSPARLRPEVEALEALRLPSLVVNGDVDPLSYLPALYALVARCRVPPSVVVVPGDHGFAAPSGAESEAAENMDLAVRSLVLWARRRAGP